MLQIAHDPASHVLCVLVGGRQNEIDNQQLYDAMDLLDRTGREKGRAVAMLMELLPGTEPLNAYWRKRFAEQRKQLSAPRALLAVVTDSSILRGVLTAMNWISPDPPHVKSTNHATWDAAAAWVATNQGTPVAVLRRLMPTRPAKQSVS